MTHAVHCTDSCTCLSLLLALGAIAIVVYGVEKRNISINYFHYFQTNLTFFVMVAFARSWDSSGLTS
jgi:hypothetical protein